jgi:predicted porin
MKKTLIALAALAAFSGVANAQTSSVSIYGILDEAARFSTDVNKAGNNQFQMVDGLESGTRIGFKGTEDLGSGLKAVFNLEGGFAVGTGLSAQGGRLFGRNATVGLSSAKLGTLTVGRQNTLAYDFDIATDAYGFGSSTLAGYQGVLTGLRFDNSVKYTTATGPVSFGAEYAFGNQTGDNGKNNAYAVSTGYTSGPVDVRVVYQRVSDTKDATPGTLAGQDQKLAAIGGSYDFGSTKLFGQYFDSKFDVTGQKNQIGVVGLSHNITSAVVAKAVYTHDKQTNVSAGNRNTVSGVLSYAFSPRTDVYTEVDYNRLSGAYSNASYAIKYCC